MSMLGMNKMFESKTKIPIQKILQTVGSGQLKAQVDCI